MEPVKLGESKMVNIIQPTDLEATLNIARQDLTAVDPVVAIALIERWQTQLEKTPVFGKLSELKQAILEGRSSTIANLLDELGQATCAMVAHVSDHGSANAEVQVDQLGELLSQAGQSLHESLIEQR
ncbi:hypothetical protein ACQ4M3_05830 [Leptolyngbya sp. AN03gr2]|uniref:hypothetical protein n=1 Tax=unclassified Leptolyngbya TaxID=2650499 RepID=UPI003D31DFC2